MSAAFAVVLPYTAADPVAAQPTSVTPPPPGPADKGGQGEDFGKSSPLGFLILVLFFVAVAFLIRSMTKHLKRLPASFDEPAEGARSAEGTPDPDGADSAEKKPENGDATSKPVS